MWHKPCRTFHHWCLCIKTRCLFMIIYDNCHCGLEECFDFIKIQSKKSKDLHRFTNVTDMTHLLKKMKTPYRLSIVILKKAILVKLSYFAVRYLWTCLQWNQLSIWANLLLSFIYLKYLPIFRMTHMRSICKCIHTILFVPQPRQQHQNHKPSPNPKLFPCKFPKRNCLSKICIFIENIIMSYDHIG